MGTDPDAAMRLVPTGPLKLGITSYSAQNPSPAAVQREEHRHDQHDGYEADRNQTDDCKRMQQRFEDAGAYHEYDQDYARMSTVFCFCSLQPQ